MKEQDYRTHKNVLVLGHTGQVGTFVKETFEKLNDTRYHIFYIESLKLEKVSDFIQIKTFMKFYMIDIVINCIAYTNVDKAELGDPLNDILNASLPRFLASLNCELYHISTDMVFDGTEDKVYVPSFKDVTSPVNKYGAAKEYGEKAIKCFGVGRTNWTIIRTSWVYSHIRSNFLTFVLSKVGTGEIPVMDQIGNPTSAKELAEFIVGMVINNKHAINFGLPQIIHFTGSETVTRKDFCEMIVEEMGYNDNVVIKDFSHLPAKRQKNCRISDSKNYENNFSGIFSNMNIPRYTLRELIRYHINELNIRKHT